MKAQVGLGDAMGEVSVGVADWMRRLNELLADVQLVLEGSALEAVEPGVRPVAAQLVPRVRACRAGVPSDEVIGLWVCQVTNAMRASAATLKPSSIAPAILESRSFLTSGPVRATKTNAGAKMPTVATTAPLGPASRYPMKVAVVKTGPGVTWPTATASR